MFIANVAFAEQPVTQVTAAYGDACVRKVDGSAWCWGDNSLDGLGDGTQNQSPNPVQAITVGSGVTSVSAGQYHTCALRNDGTMWCWGYDLDGELGNGFNDGWDPPGQVTALGTSVAQISTGYFHTCARTNDGSVWCWGQNAAGQLGDGDPTNANQALPVQVMGLGNAAVDVSAGFDHTCAVLADDSLWCWGDNLLGQLGDGTTISRPSAAPVTALGNTVAEVSANNGFTCARKTDATLWCFGGNTDGELGNGTTNNSSVPIQVAALGNSVVEVSAGDNGGCARKGDNTLWCWGSNFQGNLGDGSTVPQHTPVQVTALGNAVAEVSMGVHTCARKTDGSVWCWGYNVSGQLGDGTTVSESSPIRVPIQTAGTVSSTVPAGDWRTRLLLIVSLFGGAWILSRPRGRRPTRLRA